MLAQPQTLSKPLEAHWPQGYTVVVVAPFPPPFGGMSFQADQLVHLLEYEGVPVKRIATNEKLNGVLSFVERIAFLRTVIHVLLYAARVWRLARPNCVFHILSNSYASFFLWTAPATLICRKRGAPVIINYRGGLARDFLGKWRRVASYVFASARCVVVPSRFLEYVFLQNRIQTRVIPNIIRDTVAAKPREKTEAPHLMVNRNLDKMYNVGCALRAFALIQAQIPQARLTLIGEGPQRTELERNTERLGLRHVTFAGRLSNHEVLRLLQGCDVLLNPTNVDNMPISLLEAMALGIPIVSTEVGGVPFLVMNDWNGQLVGRNDHQAMAEAALRVLKSPSLRKRLAENSRQAAKDYRWEKVWPMWRSLYLSFQH
jgi:glycosyltransferase involved in cell wall biosynthesis